MVEFKVENIGNHVSVAELNDGYTHICVDDSCWIIVNETKKTDMEYQPWIFPEATEVLKQLPSNPNQYEPYINFIQNRS